MCVAAARLAGRSVLQDVLGRFIVSNEWRSWARSEAGAELLTLSATAPLIEQPEEPAVEEPPPAKPPSPAASQQQWDGWD